MHLTRHALSIAILLTCSAALAEPALEPAYPVYQACFNCAALSADGKLAVGGCRGAAYLWDTEKGRRLMVFRGGAGEVGSVAISGDGSRVVTGSGSGEAILWDSATGKKLHILRGHNDAISAVAISADGKRVVTASADKTAHLWDADTGKKLHSFLDHTNDILCAAISADGSRVITGSYDDFTIAWDGKTGAKLQSLQTKETTMSVALSADGKFALLGNYTSEAFFWDIDTGKKNRTLKREQDTNRQVALSGDGAIAVLSGEEMDTGQTVTVDTATGKELKKFDWHKYGVVGLGITADGKRVFTAGMFEASMHDAATGERGDSHREWFNVPLSSIALSADERYVVTGHWGDVAVIWDTQAGKAIQSLRGQRRDVESVAISADGKRVITGFFGGATLWDVATEKKLHTFEQRVRVKRVAFAANEKAIVMQPESGRPLRWNADTGKEIEPAEWKDWKDETAAPAQKIVIAGNAAKLVDAAGKELHTFNHAGPVQSSTLSADGKLAVTGSQDKTAILWNAATGQKIHAFEGHKHWVTGVALSADGKRLWTTSWDNTARLWDATTGKQVCALVSYDAGKEWLVATPDGYYDGSEGGRNHMAWREAGAREEHLAKYVDDEATHKRFYRAGLMAKLMKGERIEK